MVSYVLPFKVSAELKEGFLVEIRARKHIVVADEPAELGGTDKGMTPIELLLGSLTSCLAIATVFHAQKRGIKVKNIKAEASGSIDLRGFMGEDVKPGLPEVKVELQVDSDAPKEEMRKLIEFVEKHCPIADTLSSKTKVVLEVK